MLTFTGLANASAAVALDGRLFILADDNEHDLFLYDLERPEREPERLPIDIGGGDPDLEGAAMIGNRVWWISSHNFDGNPAHRRRLFATDVIWQGGRPSVQRATRVHRTLLDDLASCPAVAEVLGHGSNRWEKIDIEGLSATPGGGLMLGFRAPLADDMAIMVEIRNPAALVAEEEAADIADPVCVDLGGRGIRSLERVDNGYLMVGGKIGDEKKAKLFHWSGSEDAEPVELDVDLPKKFNPEAVFQLPETSTICLISDDGRLHDDEDDDEPPGFRALLFDLDELLAQD